MINENIETNATGFLKIIDITDDNEKIIRIGNISNEKPINIKEENNSESEPKNV